MDNYVQLIERISISSKLEVSEIERRIEAKRAKLSGLVSKEGAAQIVAAELGINFDQEKMKINQLVDGMKRANVVGKIIDIFPVREFNKNGREGKVVNFSLADESSNARVVLWDTNHISLIETGKLKKGDVVEITNAGVRNRELHLSSFADIKKSKEKFDNVVTEKIYLEKNLKNSKAGEVIKNRALIVQSFEPRYFEVCSKCGKKIVEGKCLTHGETEIKKRALINLVLDDGSETIRAVIFGDELRNLGLTDEEIFSLEKFNEKKAGILGSEKIFYGNIRNNELYNVAEFNIEKIEEINTDILIKELEAKSN